MLLPTKTNPITKKQSYKYDTVGAGDTIGIKLIFVIFEVFFIGLQIWDNWL